MQKDFRQITRFRVSAIKNNGEYIGQNIYWKLYQIENLYRIIIHSILLVQMPMDQLIGGDWWNKGTGDNLKLRVKNFRQDYVRRPHNTKPGVHNIYYVPLSGLNEIVRANIDHFRPIIDDIDTWIAKIEDISLPRNVVAHMNYLNTIDHNRIDLYYRDMLSLFDSIFLEASTSSIPLNIPK
jgi:hypothetical protein